jgi:hypothetical protein
MYNDMRVVTCETTLHSYYEYLRWLSDCAGVVMNVEISVAAQNEERRMKRSYVLQYMYDE